MDFNAVSTIVSIMQIRIAHYCTCWN